MENSQELNKTISELEQQVRKFKSIAEVYTELSAMKSDLIKLNEASKNTYERIKFISEKLDSKLEGYEKLFGELSKDNKNFQKELEQHITSKLDKNNSDIQMSIRNEGVQIQRAMELVLKENIMNLEKNISEKIAKSQKQQTVLSICIIVIVVVGIIASKFL